MMSVLKDSSEVQEALGLFRDLLDGQVRLSSGGPPGAVGRNLGSGFSPGASADPAEPPSPRPTVKAPALRPVVLQPPTPPPEETATVEGKFRGDKLENVLVNMCRRGNFSGAVVSDSSGLPMAVFNSPVEMESIAAFTSVLGDALDKAGRFLEEHGADYISMDVNYEDKAVVRRFAIAEMDLYLMVICGQSIDERSEVEVSIQQIVSILG